MRNFFLPIGAVANKWQVNVQGVLFTCTCLSYLLVRRPIPSWRKPLVGKGRRLYKCILYSPFCRLNDVLDTDDSRGDGEGHSYLYRANNIDNTLSTHNVM